MTREEAIEVLEEMSLWKYCEPEAEAAKFAIAALREQDVPDTNVGKTNADHIRSMTDEDLAVWMEKWCRATEDCDECPLSDNCPQAGVGVTMLEWLKQPYKEEV